MNKLQANTINFGNSSGYSINTKKAYSESIKCDNIEIDSISLDAVINSLNGFKKAIYNNYYLLNLVNKYKKNIKCANRYDCVLQPIVKRTYLVPGDYFWVMSAPSNKESLKEAMYYYTWETHKDFNNKLIKNVPNIE